MGAPTAPTRLPLSAFLHGRRWWPWTLALAAAIGLVVLIILDRHGYLLYRGDDWLTYHNRWFRVERIEGSTLVLATPRSPHPTSVRVWGIDEPVGSAWDPDQTAALVRGASDQLSVRLTLEHHRTRDSSDRVLAHVWLADGSLLSEQLVSRGLARAHSPWSHAFDQRLAMLERQAQREHHPGTPGLTPGIVPETTDDAPDASPSEILLPQ